jgi:hypothetical protein
VHPRGQRGQPHLPAAHPGKLSEKFQRTGACPAGIAEQWGRDGGAKPAQRESWPGRFRGRISRCLAEQPEAHALSVFYNDFAFTGTPPDDVGFLRALINTLQSNLEPDPKNIYVTGFSVGGYMAHRAGVQLSGLVAAVGVVEETLYAIAPDDTRTVPAAPAPVSVLIFHRDEDSAINYCARAAAHLQHRRRIKLITTGLATSLTASPL